MGQGFEGESESVSSTDDQYWDTRSPNAVATVQLADKASSMDVQGKLMASCAQSGEADV